MNLLLDGFFGADFIWCMLHRYVLALMLVLVVPVVMALVLLLLLLLAANPLDVALAEIMVCGAT